MATEDVLVEIGAKIDGLISSVDQVKSKLSEINSHSQALNTGFRRLGEAIIAAFSVDQIGRFVEKMAELGLQTERTMAQLGLSAEATVQLQGMAALTGTSMEGLTLAFERLYLNVQRSTRDAFNPAAQALHVLGLSAKEVIATGGDATKVMDLFHNSVSQFAPSMNLTAAVMAAGGRGVAQIIPLLRVSNEEWNTMKLRIAAAQEGLSAAIPGMAETHRNLILMDLSIQSFGARLFSVLKPAIDGAIKWVTDFVQSLDSDTIRTRLLQIGDWFIDFYVAVRKLFIDLKAVVDDFAESFFGVTLTIKPGSLADMLTNYLKARIQEFKEQYDKLKTDVQDDITPTGVNHIADAAAKAKEEVDKLGDSLKTALGASLALSGAPPTKEGGKAAGAIDFGAAKGAADALKIAQDNYTQQAYYIKELYGDFIFYESAKTEALRGALQIRYNAQVAAGMSEKVAAAELAKDLEKINFDSLKKQERDWQAFAMDIESSFNSQLRGLLAGTTTWAQAMKNMLADLVIKFIEGFEKIAINWIIHETLMSGATEAQTAVRTATEAAGATAGLGAKKAAATASITTDLGPMFAGFTSFFAALLGPGAPAAAATLTTLSGEEAMGLAALEIGTNYIPTTGLYQLHQGEAVTPAAYNPAAGGDGMGGIAVTINAVDSQSVANLLQGNKGIITQIIQRVARDNPKVLAGAFAGVSGQRVY